MSGAERQGLAESGKTGGKPILVADGSLADRLLHGKKPLEDVGKGAKPPGAKADAKADVKDAKDDKLPPPEDGTEIAVKVSYKKVSSDPKNTEFDDPIKKTVRYNTIEITDMPADGVYIKHWRDDDGRFFFWFSDKEGKNIDGKNHYYPGNVHKLKVGDKVQDVDAQRRKVNDAWNRSKNKIDLRDDVLTISITDGDFDKKIASTTDYHTLKITDVGKDCKLEYGMDDKGFFFKAQDGKEHYFKGNVRKISLNGEEFDMNQQRMKIIQEYAKKKGAPIGSISADHRERLQVTVPQDRTMQYLMRMNKVGADQLDVLDKRLTEAVEAKQKTDDPFFKTWSRWALAQVRAGEVIPMIQRNVLAGKPLNDPAIIDKLDKAIDMLDTAKTDSSEQLKKIRKYPPTNTPLMMLDPWEALGKGGNEGYYMFWGGCYDQTGWLKLQLTLWRDLMKSNIFQIPPERPE